MIKIADIQIHLINAGDHLVDPGGAFGLVPRALWSRVLEPVESFLVPMVLTCLLLRVDGKNILVDVGYGDKLPEKMQRILHLQYPGGGLLPALARLDIAPEDIDLVVNTHLHYDHAGGNTKLGVDNNVLPVFPNAEHVVQRREYDDAMNPNERTQATYLPFNYAPLVASGQMRLLDGDTEFFPGVRGVLTPGHTPGHMSVVIERGGQHAMFVCDLASYAVHFQRLGWMTAYDVEPLVTLETKRVWQRWALENDALLIFPHDPKTPVARLRAGENGRPQIMPVDVSYV